MTFVASLDGTVAATLTSSIGSAFLPSPTPIQLAHYPLIDLASLILHVLTL